jgi:xanthine/uracil permease
MADGIVSTTAAIFGCFPSATYAQNNGVIQLTGVASRRVAYLMAALLCLLGLVPAVGRWVTVMPPAVLGGLALLMFGLVTVAGVRLVAASGLGQREGVMVALALGVGVGRSWSKSRATSGKMRVWRADTGQAALNTTSVPP